MTTKSKSKTTPPTKAFIFIPYYILGIDNLLSTMLRSYMVSEVHCWFDRGILYAVDEEPLFKYLSSKYELYIGKIFRNNTREYCYIFF